MSTTTKPVSKIKREDPDPGPKRYDWAKIAEQLRSDPGEWYKIFDHDRTSLVTGIRQGGVTHLRAEDGFEVMTRNNIREPRRMCTLYLRYNPKKKVKN